MTTLTSEQRKARIAGWAKWGIGLAGAILIAPFIYLAIKGLLGLSLALVLGLAIVHGAPVLSLKFANWKLKGLKHEARQNPIETRQNIAMQARSRIRDGERELATFATEVRNFSDQVKDLRYSQPEDAADFDEQLAALQRLLELKRQRLAEAKRNADEFEAATARAANKWKVAQAAIRMQKLSGAMEDDAMNKLLAAESLDSVQSAMNRALSELDSALAMEAPPALPQPSTPPIDVHAVEIRERVRQ